MTEIKKRGFAALDPERLRELARQGGKSVPNEKRTFSLNRELAATAGRLGGLATPGEKRSFATNPGLAATAGRKGGLAARKTSDE
jgi:general stress protein YciG